MSQQVNGVVKSFKALDASIPAYRVVFLATNGTVDLCETSTVMGFGISAQDVSTAGEAIPIILGGTAKAQCGASVSAGALLTWQTATGLVVEAVANSVGTATAIVPKAIGISLENGDTNSIIEILVAPQFVDKDTF